MKRIGVNLSLNLMLDDSELQGKDYIEVQQLLEKRLAEFKDLVNSTVDITKFEVGGNTYIYDPKLIVDLKINEDRTHDSEYLIDFDL